MNNNFSAKCFVCEKPVKNGNFTMNEELNLPVCDNCKGSEEEKEVLKKLIEGLVDGFVCGCI